MNEYVKIKAAAMKGVNELSLKGEIVIFGSTYMANFPFYDLINKCSFEHAVYNRSIEGLTIPDAFEIAQDCVIPLQPSKLFLSLGEEDKENPQAAQQYEKLVRMLRTNLPKTQLYLICLNGLDEQTEAFNAHLVSLCDKKQIHSIHFSTLQTSDAAQLKARFKQLSCFFRNRPLRMTDAFAVTDV